MNWAAVPQPESYTICSSDNSKVVIVNLEESSKGEYCSNFKDSYKSFTEIIYSDEDLTFDVYSLDGKPVDLIIGRYRRAGEEYIVEYNNLRIPRKGKASLVFSQEQNPRFKIDIDRNNDGKVDKYKLPDTLMTK